MVKMAKELRKLDPRIRTRQLRVRLVSLIEGFDATTV
jgi:hypothetical protein